MTYRLRVLPRFPANISGSVGLTVEREGVDLVIKPDYGALTQVPSVIDPDTTFLPVWSEEDDSYARMSFTDVSDAVVGLGFMRTDTYDPTGIAADVFARANHTGEQAISTVTGLQTALDAKAPIASPAFTGNPTAPTPSAADNDTSIATTAFVQGELTTALALKANLASPAFTGNPTAPTPSPGDNDTSIATTAFVTAAVGASAIFTKQYQSANQTITSGGTLSLSHGLGAVPKFVMIELVCLTAEFGYSVGDVIEYSNVNTSSTANVAWGVVISKTSTTLGVTYGNNAQVFGIFRKDTGAPANLTNTNWQMVVRAFA